MKINGNTVKVGNVLDYEGKLWVVVKTQHTQPGKGGAYMQVEMKAMVEGTKTNVRFRASEQVERVYLEEIPYQYLYEEDDMLVLMDQDTFEQISIEKNMVGDTAVFLQDGMVVKVCTHEGKPLTVSLPSSVTLVVEEADAVVKGQTASSSFKPAVLENGIRVLVPQHIESGMKIVVNTEDRTYVERAKE